MISTIGYTLLLAIALIEVSDAKSNNKTFQANDRQISSNIFSCDSSDSTIRAICSYTLEQLNSELKATGVSLDHNGLLFNYDDPKDVKIDTGHSCSVTAQVRHKHVSARLSSNANLDLSGKSLTEPLAIRLKLPVSISGRVDIKQRFGIRLLFGSCSTVGSDSFSFKGSAHTTANVVIGLTLNPSLGRTPSGDFLLAIKPQVATLFALEHLDFNFRVSGVSPIAAVVSVVSGLSSTFFKSVTALFKGDSVSSILKDSLPFDLGAPLLLGVGALPKPLEEAVWKSLTNYGVHVAAKKAAGFGDDIESELNKKVRRALRLDSSGRRSVLLRKDIVELVAAGKNGSDILSNVPANPYKACRKEISALCNSCRGCMECRKLSENCDQLSSEHRHRYAASHMVAARPKIASQIAAATPPPRQGTSPAKQKEGCFRNANMICVECRGCLECIRLQKQCSSM